MIPDAWQARSCEWPKEQGIDLFSFFSQSRLCHLFRTLPEKRIVTADIERYAKSKEEESKKRTRRRKLDFPHSEPVTYLFCKDAFCTNNKAAVR